MPDENKNVVLDEAAAEGVKQEAETGNAETPPVGGGGGRSPGRPRKSPGVFPPADGDKPPVSPNPPDKGNGKQRIKCVDMKGKKVIVGKGSVVQIDENGFFEVDVKEAERLLSIPGYEEA